MGWTDDRLRKYAARIIREGEDSANFGKNDTRVRRAFWPKLKRVARRIPFAEDLVAAYYCATDPATPARVKGILLAALAYFVLPIDLIPDFIVALGFSDDATVLMMAVMSVRAHITDQHQQRAREALQDLPPDDDGDGKIIDGEVIAEG